MSQPQINRQPQKQQRCGDDGHLLLAFGGVVFCLFIALWAVGIDIALPSALFISALLGFLFASALVHNAHLCFCLQIVLAQLFELLPTDDALSNVANCEQSAETGQNKETEEKQNSDNLLALETTNYIAPPWERIRINAQLNRELEELFETLLDCYVSSWYTDLISTDTAFLLEVRHLIRHSSAKLINRLIGVDLHSLFINDLFPLVLAHVERICRLTNAICRHENRLEIAQMPASLIEYKVLDRWSDDFHWAMRSPANCDAYMRTVADLLIRQFVDDIRIGGCFVDEEHAKILSTNGGAAISSTAAKWSCHSSRHFLRELLFSSVLVPAMDFVADPDSLNRLTLNKLNDDYGGGGAEYSTLAAVVPDEQESLQRDLSPVWQEPFLARFVEPYYTNMPDSLLGLKLNDLVENQYLTKLFEMYLRDLNGPTHLLDCFVQARDIHLRIQTLNSAKFGVNSENQGYQRESSEICFDAWQLFSTFVHSNGPNRIPLDGRIEAEFSAVLESNGSGISEGVQEVDQPQHKQQQQKVCILKPLEKVIEAIYQQAYANLQYNYVIPFWQSENYLGYLCGAPPDVDELISGPSDDCPSSRRVPTKIPEGSFSLAQFRKKLFNFITPTKDIPSSSASSLFHQSSFSSMTAIETLGGTFASAEVDLDCAGTIAMADLSRDMAKWSVTIDGVAQRRANQQTVYHIYLLSVERNDLPDECYTTTKVPSRMPSASSAAEEVDEDFDDADNFQEEEEEDLPKVWTVGHRCEEFFALEDRLREHCGNTFRLGNSSTLPDRKTTLQMLQNGRNNRALMETYRIHFERFLHQLLQQPNMKRSDLLYIFLTSEENSTGLFELATSGDSGGGSGGWRSGTATNFLPDLNPIRAMRKVGGKERGQNLKPFILNLLANTLAPPMRQNLTPMMTMQQRSSEQSYQSGDTTSIKSEAATARSSDGGRRSVSVCSNSKPCSISAYNFPGKSENSSSSDDYQHPHSEFGTRNFYDLFLFFSLRLGLIARFPIWLEALLCSLRTFVGFLLSIVFRRKTEQILDDNLFNVQMAIYLVRSLHELILFQNVPSSSSSLHATPSQNSMTSAAAAVPSGKQTTTGDEQKMQRKPMTLVAGTTTAKSAGAAAKSPSISEQERKLRAELALHCLEKWVERTLPMSPFLRWIFGRFASVSSPCMAEGDGTGEEEGETTDQNNQLETSVRQLFLCFQMSTLNRQLAFVLMDKLLQKIVIERPQTADYGAEVNDRKDTGQ